ncbi:MAG: DUF4339 domain-containing protein [Planctomycetota bacterium]
MAIRFKCPNGHTLQVKQELAGKRGACPECRAVVVVPNESTLAPAPSAADQPAASQPAAAKPLAEPVAAAARPAATEASVDAASAPPPAKPVARAVAKAVAKPVAAPQPAAPQPAAPPRAPTGQWYLRADSGEQFGPASDEQFRQWITDRRVAPESYIWRDGWAEWRVARDAAGELPAPLLPTSVAPDADATSAATRYVERRKRARNRRVLLAICLLVLTLALGGVLAFVLLSDLSSTANESGTIGGGNGAVAEPGDANAGDNAEELEAGNADGMAPE